MNFSKCASLMSSSRSRNSPAGNAPSSSWPSISRHLVHEMSWLPGTNTKRCDDSASCSGQRDEERRRGDVLRRTRGLGDVAGHQDEADGLAPAEIAARFVERLATLRGEALEVPLDKPAVRTEVQVRELEQHQRRDQVGAGGILPHGLDGRVSHRPGAEVDSGSPDPATRQRA